MKSLLLSIVMFFCIEHSDYYLSIKKSLELQSSSVDQISSYLTTHGWKLSLKEAETDSTRGSVEWSFDNKNGQSKAWFGVHYTEGEPNRLIYQILSKEDYDGLEKQIKGLGFVRHRTTMRKTGIRKVYRNKDNVISVDVSTEGGITGYLFSFYSIDDYMNNLDK
ncbi:MAG TPA: hypothetical protein VGO58_12140 [Chitinophagaceae bacterium]|jgi:hypothetical protein|nr:hypothetical protein [Chitinophagaceae bacterium]